MNHFDKHRSAWCPAQSGNQLDGICFRFDNDGRVVMDVSADQRATFAVGDRSFRRLQNLIGDMIEYNGRDA